MSDNACGKNDKVKRCPKCESSCIFELSYIYEEKKKYKCCNCRNIFGEK